MASGDDQKIQRRHIVILVIVAIVAWAPSLKNGFVWLDHVEIEEAGYVLRNADDFQKVWQWSLDDFLDREHLSAPGPRGSYFRPVYAVANTVSAALWKNRAALWHLESVLWHALVVALLFLLGQRILRKENTGAAVPVAFWASLLFAVHPIAEQSVAWISGRKDTLCVALFLIAIHSYLNTGEAKQTRRRMAWAGVCVLFFLAALGSKELALLVPAFLTATIVTGILRRPDRPQLALLGVLWLAAIGFAVYRAGITGGFGLGAPPPDTSVTGRIAMSAAVFLEYGARILLPRPGLLSDAWPLRDGGAGDLLIIAVAIAIVAAMAFCFFKFARARFALLWFFFWLVPASGVTPLWHFRAERYLYPASWGLLLAAVVLLEQVCRPAGKNSGTYARLTLGAVSAALVVLTWSALPRWRTDASLFGDAARRDPNHAEAQLMLAEVAVHQEDHARAETYYRNAIAIAEKKTHAVYLSPFIARSGLGMSLYRQGRFPEALAEFKQAATGRPGNAAGHYHIGLVALAMKDLALAERAFREALPRSPGDILARANLAVTLMQKGDLEGCLAMYEPLISGGWDNLQGLRNYASVLLALQRFENARPIFEKIVSADPRDALSLAKLAWCQDALGEPQRARQTLETALSIDPSHPAIRDIAARLSREK